MSQGGDLLQHNCSAVNVNDHFFLTSVTFKVGNELFQIPRFLFPKSEIFTSRYPKFLYEGNNRVELNDCTSAQFEAFLTVIFQPLQCIFPSSHPIHLPLHLDLILSALELATKWGFQDTRDELKGKASCLIPTAFQKIALGRKYRMPSWFREGLEELVASDADISLDDAEVIGMGFALRVYHARSRYARGRSAMSDLEPIKDAIEQVFAADLESLTMILEDHVEETRMPVHNEQVLPQEEAVPLAADTVGNDHDRSPSFVSITAELNSSTVLSDEHEAQVFNEHHDYSTSSEYYTRPPSLSTDPTEESVFAEGSVISDVPSFQETTVTVDEEAVMIKPSPMGDVIVIQTTAIQPINVPLANLDEDVTTPRPATDPHVPTGSFSLPASPSTFRKISAPAVLIPVAQSPAEVSPEKPQTAASPFEFTSPPVKTPEPAKVTTVVQPKSCSSTSTSSIHARARDDALIRDVLRCILDPTLPMPSRVPNKVPKMCGLPAEDCGPSMRCDPCCLQEAHRYRSRGWLPKAKTTHGQVFLDLYLDEKGGITTLKETLEYIPKTCKKSDKNCGGRKRCVVCCKTGVKKMMDRGEIV
ncbi:hypothetical protein L218DRAFT_1076677 [Marasmius fiardii PR-910]|nr:hypothetical protein L218DRAFT_1076677 [Marasmius fiardii PR-910]